MDADDDLAYCTLDRNGCNTGCVIGLLKVISDRLIFDQIICEILLGGIPTGVPILDNAYAEAIRINFLSHSVPP